MTTLVLELRAGEMMIVNGAPMRFRTKTRVELTAKARFLFGKQIMAPEQADSPARRIYFAFQAAYIGSDEERPAGLAAARDYIASFNLVATSALAREIMLRALAAAEEDDCYRALKLVRRVIRDEDSIREQRAEASAAQLQPEHPSEARPHAQPRLSLPAILACTPPPPSLHYAAASA